MKYYFPASIDDDFNHNENIRNITILRIEQSINPSEHTLAEIAALEQYFVNEMAPISFRMVDGKNIIIENEKKFDKLCTSFAEAGMDGAKFLSMYDFRIRMEYFEEKGENLKSRTNADQQI